MWTGGSTTKACDLRCNYLRDTLGRVGKLRDTGRGRADRETRKRSGQVDGSKGGRTRQLVTWTRTGQYWDQHPSSSRGLREIWPSHILGFSLSVQGFKALKVQTEPTLTWTSWWFKAELCIPEMSEKKPKLCDKNCKGAKVQREISSTPVTKQSQGFFVCLFCFFLFWITLKIKLYFRP